MRVLNFMYENDGLLIQKLRDLKDEPNVFIQIFCSSNQKSKAQILIDSITMNLPQAKILLTSSFGELSDGSFYTNKIALCISIFQKTTIETFSFPNTAPEYIADEIAKNVSHNTKLIVMFGNCLVFNTSKLLDCLTERIPHIPVAGGNAGDDVSFNRCFVGSDKGIGDSVIAAAILDSEVLQVYSDSIFNYNRIGLDMVVTDCEEGGLIRTLNNQPILDIYERYLGKYIADTLPTNGYQFPLIFDDGDLLVGRSAFIKTRDNALIYGGDIKKGAKVKFGVASSIDNMAEMSKRLVQFTTKNIDCFYVYTCVGRYFYFKDTIMDYNAKIINNVAPMSGFFTFGEFYHHNNKNYVLNNTNTLVALSEGINELKSNTIHELEADTNSLDIVIYGLRNLSYVSNNDYLEIMGIFKQYKDLLEKSLFVVYFDTNGNIIDCNKSLLEISGFKRNELVGKKFSAFIAKDSANSIDDIWAVLQKRQTFSGILKNITADNNSFFYAKAIIKPIINAKDEIMMYVCSLDDITDFEIKKQNLERSVNVLTEVSVEKDYLIQNYQTLLDRSTAMVVMQDEKFIEVNKSCEEMFGYTKDEMVNRHVSLIFKPEADIPQKIANIRKDLRTHGFTKVYLNCIDSKNKPLYLQVYLMAVKSNKNNPKYNTAYGIFHNVTELFQMQQELEDVQKEVLYAMGTISEGRSRETGNHIKRVAEFTYLLANLYGLDKQQAELLKIASPMHDIGKLAIPDAILNKPGKLTDEEFEIMKTHAQQGYDMLCFSNRSILKTAAEIALTHHEWWNGNGYPQKLKATQIPLCGRIVAVADVFDALSHDRCYKKAWPINEVVEHMMKNKGVQFEAKLVDLLVEHIDSFVKIKEEYADKF